MRSAWIIKPGTIEIRETSIPEPKSGEVRIKVEACGICGTDVHLYRGEYLGEYPMVPGHEFSGTIDAAGPDAGGFRPGEKVAVEPNIACGRCAACLNNRQNFCENWTAVGVGLPGGFAEYVCAPVENVFRTGDLDFEQGAFVEPLSCVVHGIQKAAPRIGDRIAVLGAGPIGLLIIQLLKHYGGCRIEAAERNDARRALAGECGAHTVETIEQLEPDAFDMVIDATGSPVVMNLALSLARPGGKVLWFGVPPKDAELPLKPFEVFRKGLTILASYTSVRNSHTAIRLLAEGSIDVGPLVSHRLPLEKLEEGIRMIGSQGVKKVLILP